jgi:hypothetical protein
MFQPIRRILPGSIRDAGLESQITAVRILDEAKATLNRLWGEECAAYVEPTSYTEGVLTVDVRSASAAHTITASSVRWMNEINRGIGFKKVDKIRVRRMGF